MDGPPRAVPVSITGQYEHITGCESDDSSTSRSENEGIPGIIYTSDDSADVGQLDTTSVDSDGPAYIAQNVCHSLDDGSSRQLLLDSEISSAQPSPQPQTSFPSHPLTTLPFSRGSAPDVELTDGMACVGNDDGHLCVELSHLQVHSAENVSEFTRSTSVSSESSECSPEGRHLLPDYEPLTSDYLQLAETEFAPLNFENLALDPVKTKMIPLNKRWMVGAVAIDYCYKDAFYVKWNWHLIRQSCVLLNTAVLVALFCIGVSLLVQMPRGKDCDPSQEWWQGSVTYQVFVPSFQDSNGDGVGDLPGLINRLGYVKDLGVKTLRLASIFDEAAVSPGIMRNLSAIDSEFGTESDVRLLCSLLHEQAMFLMLDLPISVSQVYSENRLPFPKTVDDRSTVGLELSKIDGILDYWLSVGIDGFFFLDIDSISDDPNLMHYLQIWRNRLDAHSHGLDRRIMMVPAALLDKMPMHQSPYLHHLLSIVDLIDMPVDMTLPATEVSATIVKASEWVSLVSYPWINWNIGGIGRDRVAVSTNSSTLGRSLLLLFFPGSITLYYGDEIDLGHLGSVQHTDMSWASPMQWSDEAHAGFSEATPWMEVEFDWDSHNVLTSNSSLETLKKMVLERQNEVPLYIKGIFYYEEEFHSEMKPNYKIRYVDSDLLVLDRFYPRRQQFCIVANLGSHLIERDLSHLYYGGEVVASSHDKSGYLKFRYVSLLPGEAFACILDK